MWLQERAFVYDDADKQFDLTFNAIRNIRSLATSYNLFSDIQSALIVASVYSGANLVTLAFLHITNDADAALFESQIPTMLTLTKGCKSIKVVRNVTEIPAGCGSAVLTQTIGIHILVRVREPGFFSSFSVFILSQGLVDLDTEIAKIDKKLGLSRLNLEKVLKLEAQPEYETTVPANVRLFNEDKVCRSLL